MKNQKKSSKRYIQTFTSSYMPYIKKIVSGLIILIIAHIFGSYLYHLIINHSFDTNTEQMQHKNLAYNVTAHMVYYSILVLSLLILMNIYGIETTSIVALFGASGIAVGLALQGTLIDFFSGILQAINQKFKIGDVILYEGRLQRVIEFTLLYTTVQDIGTLAILKIPNHQFEKNAYMNYTASKRGYANIQIAISNDKNKVEYDKIFIIIRDAIKQNNKILTDEEPTVFVNDMSKGYTNINIKIPINTNDFPLIFSELSTSIRIALQKNDVQLASYREAFTTIE
jgi:small conductance mechanosensitive channel